MARRGGDRPDRRDRYDPRDGHDEYRDRDQRRVVRRDEAGYDSPRRPDTRGGRPNPPPIRPSALVADTVLLQPVPAWSTPARPRNDGPPVRPTAPDALPNAAPRGVEKSMPPEPSANASRRHDDRPEGRLYGGR